MHYRALPLVVLGAAAVHAQTWQDVVTKTAYRTHYYCPCDGSTDVWKPDSATVTWSTWSYAPSTTMSSARTTTSTMSKKTTTTTTTTTSTSKSTSSTTTTGTTSTPSGCTTGISAARSAQVANSFTQSGVVPTLIPGINPTVDVLVNYNGKAVNLGNQFTTAETLLQPSLTFTSEAGRDPNTDTYSYFLVDPDVPSPSGAPVAGLRVNYLHWLVSGARSLCATAPATNQQTVAAYQSLTPASTDEHRYTFLVYREPANYVPDTVTPQVRAGFDLNAYAAKAGLTLVGGNFLLEAITNGVVPSTTITTTIPPITTTTTTALGTTVASAP